MGVTQIVALSAAQGTGKTELADALVEQLRGLHASVSGFLTAELTVEGVKATPQLLRDRGEILALDPVALVSQVLDHYNWDRRSALVFDSIRHQEVLTVLRDSVAPFMVLHVALVVPEVEREARLRARNREPFDPGLARHSTEVQVPALVQAADLILDGTRDTGQLVSEVVEELARR